MGKKVINLFGDKNIVQNKGVKYSELMEQFMAPFIDEFKHLEYVEDIFEFAINAWNLGNMKKILPKDENEILANYIKEEDIDVDLLNRMIHYKVANFKKYTNFIVDYELKETSGDPILSVITQAEKDYLSNMMNNIDDQVSQDDLDENYINRYAIIIKPQQPFLDWYSNLNPEDEFEEDIKKTNIYLVDETIDDIEKWLKKEFDRFFTMELDEWHTDKKEWPQKRNYKMFKQWFQVDVSTMIYDLEKKPVLKVE